MLTGTAAWGVEAARLPTVVWTRAPEGMLGRHPCVPADDGGTHFASQMTRMGHVQQVLNAIALTAVDRPGWSHTQWWQRTWGPAAQAAAQCPSK